jgi:hypothetical protein
MGKPSTYRVTFHEAYKSKDGIGLIYPSLWKPPVHSEDFDANSPHEALEKVVSIGDKLGKSVGAMVDVLGRKPRGFDALFQSNRNGSLTFNLQTEA